MALLPRNLLASWLQRIPGDLLVVVFGLTVTGAAWLYVSNEVRLDRQAEITRVHRENDALARTFEEHVRRVFQTADNVLLFLKLEYEKHGGVTEEMIDFVNRAKHDTFLNQIAIADARGDLIVSAVSSPKAINVSRNETFRIHAESDAAGLYVGKPILTQIAGTWSFMLTRRLNRGDGTFAGNVAVALDPAYFSKYYDALEIGTDRAVILAGRDGIVRARRFQKQSEVGQDLSASPMFARLSREPVGHHEVVGTIDQLPRLASYRALPDFPLVVAVSDLASSALAPFQQRRGKALRSASLFTLFVTLFCAALIAAGRRERRQGELLAAQLAERRRTDEALRESGERYRDLFENANDAIFLLDDQHRYRSANRRAAEIFGYAPEELVGRAVFEFIPPEQARSSESAFRELEQRGSYDKFEGRMRTKDGRWLDIEVNSSAIVRDGVFTGSRDIVRDITKRKRAEEALKASERRLRESQEVARIGSWSWNLADNTLEWSEEAFRRFDMDPATFTPTVEYFTSLIHPEDRGAVVSAIQASLADDAPYHIMPRIRNESGREWILEGFGRVERDADGRPARFAGTVQDVTDRSKAEEALQKSEVRFQLALRGANDGLWDWDLSTDEVYYSPRWKSMLGYGTDELEHTIDTWKRLVHPDDKERVLGAVRALLEGHCDKFDVEFRMRHKDGSLRHILSRAFLCTAPASGRQRLVGTHVDITERKQVEEKLRQSEQFVRSILDTVDEGFIVVDRDFRILTANKAYCGQTGLTCDEAIGRRCHEVSHKSAMPCFETGEECAVRRVFETGRPHAATHKHPGQDGHLLFVETKAFPIKDESGNTTSVIETLNNITEKHLLEEERLKTQKLESIGTLAGGIAHDFNNLLQGIFGYISMAKMSIDQKDRSLAMIEQAEKALQQSVSLTTQLLTFSKGGKPVRELISLEPVLEDAVRFALSGSRAEFRMLFDPGLWRVDADPGQLSQVIQNIALNADQAMPHGGRVEILARNVPPTDPDLPPDLPRRNHVLISIRDSGVGLNAQDLERIFDPYFTTKEKGSGLGLATSYSIVRNHEGRIFARSEVGKGCTFFIVLPASDTVAAAPAVAPAAAKARAARILVMDDEEIIRNVTGELLAVLGHSVAFADKGEAAIETYLEARDAGRSFDLVILDLTIRGGMGGAETMARLRAIDPDVLAVASSGYSDDVSQAGYSELGFTAFLKKPYNLKQLQELLGFLLNGSSRSLHAVG